jgi:uncharacterized protein (DUF2062 family)
MYRQRPAFPALISAVVVLLFGGALILWEKSNMDDGIGDVSSIILTGCITCGAVLVLLVSAFARYQFTHLWKKPQHPKADEVKNLSRGRW